MRLLQIVRSYGAAASLFHSVSGRGHPVVLPQANSVNPPSRPQTGRSNWPKDFFGKSEVLAQYLQFLPLLGLLILCIFLASSHLLRSSGEAVVVYTSQDQ